MSDQATFLQIDLQTLFYEARNLGQKIDFEKIWNYFHTRETENLIGANIYLVRSEELDSQKFEAKLQSIGYKICAKTAVLKEGVPVYRGVRHDINITIDCFDKMDLFNKWILMSTNDSFADLCKYLRFKNKKIEIWNFRNSYSSKFEAYADKMSVIGDDFFYKKPKVTVFGFNSDPSSRFNSDSSSALSDSFKNGPE
jgi:uncharacterized LabA/DUF88 family protein